jgi:transcription termination factor Rho
MSVLSRSALESSPLADLHEIALELGLDGFRRLRKADLVDAILERQGGEPEADAEPDAEPDRAARAAARRLSSVVARRSADCRHDNSALGSCVGCPAPLHRLSGSGHQRRP